MAGPIFLDRAGQITTTSGVLTTITLGDVITGGGGFKPIYQSDKMALGDWSYFIVRHVDPRLTEWQVFKGFVTNATTITVDVIGSSSNAGNTAVTFSAGNKYVILDASATFLMGITAANGTVTSVGLASDSDIYTVTGSPVSTSGTLTFNKTPALAANLVYATPSGVAGVIGLRALVALDIPNLSATYSTPAGVSTQIAGATILTSQLSGNLDYSRINGTGPFADAFIPNLNASKITLGQLALARGGTNADLSVTGGAISFLRQASAGAAVTVGSILAADLPNHSAALLTSGDIGAARMSLALASPSPIGSTTPNTGAFTTTTIKQSMNEAPVAGVWTPSFSLLDTTSGVAFEMRSNFEFLAIGTNAGRSARGTAYNSLVVGHSAGYSLTTGQQNLLIGTLAGRDITTQLGNLFLGAFAGLASTGGTNVFIGNSAGAAAGAASGSVFIGNGAGGTTTRSNTLILHNADSATPLIYGEFDTPLLRTYAPFSSFVTNTAGANVTNLLTLNRSSSGAGVAGYGLGILGVLKSSTTTARSASLIETVWNVATDAAAIPDLNLVAYHNAAGTLTRRVGFTVRGGASGVQSSVNGVAPVTPPTYGAASGTLNRAAFNSGTATAAEVAQAVAALITDLKAFGIAV